ncbi:MAG: hypothetical protein ABSA93_35840 [Streptosporangiaceae bacterium]|jgi:uncharacterized protein YcaQ
MLNILWKQGMDRKKGMLVVEGVFAEPSAPASAWPAIASALSSLASLAGGDSVTFTGPMPRVWACTNTAVGGCVPA